eukprot:1244516-Rhodomonas_salina.1
MNIKGRNEREKQRKHNMALFQYTKDYDFHENEDHDKMWNRNNSAQYRKDFYVRRRLTNFSTNIQ